MPITTQSELPEWENLVAQVSALYKLFPEITALRATMTSIDRLLAIVQTDVATLKSDMAEVRRRLEHVEWNHGAGVSRAVVISWPALFLGLLAIVLLAMILYLVATK